MLDIPLGHEITCPEHLSLKNFIVVKTKNTVFQKFERQK
jgi:hypothetical protein